MIPRNLRTFRTYTTYMIEPPTCICSPTLLCTPSQSVPYSTCLFVMSNKLFKCNVYKTEPLFFPAYLFLILSSPSQLNDNSILIAQAKNPKSFSICPFLPLHILHIGKSYQLYLQHISRIRLYYKTSTTTTMIQTTIIHIALIF